MAVIDTAIVEEVIDRLQDAKGDLLSAALVAKSWVPRSRYHFVEKFWSNIQLKSFDELLRFTQLLNSPFCTITSTFKVLGDLTLDSRPSRPGPLRPDAAKLLSVGDGFLSFFENTVVDDSVDINMEYLALQDSQCSPFPWSTIAQWTNLSNLTITATLPSLTTLVAVILGLTNLSSAELDVVYLDAALPGLPSPSLPRSFRYIAFGSHGHQLFSWLALCPTAGVHFFSLTITIGTEDLTPFKEFVISSAHYSIDWLEVTFQADRVAEFTPVLPFLRSVNELTVSLHFSPSAEASYKDQIRSVAAAVNPFLLSCLRFKIPSRLAIPWPLTRPTPRHNLDTGLHNMQNHIMLASLDQREVGPLQDYAVHCVELRCIDFEEDDDADWDSQVDVWVSADRGAVCYT